MSNVDSVIQDDNGSGIVGTESQPDGSASDPVGYRGAAIVIDPATASSDRAGSAASGGNDGNRTGGKRRGRKPGSGRKSNPQSAALDVNAISSTLYSVHAMLAGVTRSPLLKLDEAESKLLATASANVARHYNVMVSQKAMDWGNLFMALGMVYGTRIIAGAAAQRAKKQAVKETEPETVMRPNGGVIMGDIDPGSPLAAGMRVPPRPGARQ